MDSGGAGGTFGREHFISPFRCPRDNVHWRTEQCATAAAMNSEKQGGGVRGCGQSYDFKRLERPSVIPACGITLGGL